MLSGGANSTNQRKTIEELEELLRLEKKVRELEKQIDKAEKDTKPYFFAKLKRRFF